MGFVIGVAWALFFQLRYPHWSVGKRLGVGLACSLPTCLAWVLFEYHVLGG